MIQEKIVPQAEILTERFTLRPVRKSDAGLFALYAGDKRVAEATQGIPHPLPPGAAEGFCARFGLYTVDYRSPARPRVPTPGAATMRRIIDDNQVSDALLREVPAYHPPTLCHPRPDAGT